MKYEINFDKNMAAEFYAELISSVNFARIAKMHNWFDQADGYVNAFRKTLKLLRWFGADTEVETGSSEIRYAAIYKDGKRYVIVRDRMRRLLELISINLLASEELPTL